MKRFIAKVRMLLEQLRPNTLRGYSVFNFRKGDKTGVARRLFTKGGAYALMDLSTIEILSVITDATPVGLPVDIATLRANISKNVSIEFKFFAQRKDFETTEYFLSVFTYDSATKNITVLSSRALAELKAASTRFKMKVDWSNKSVSVSTPVKLQVGNQLLSEQYSFELPEYTDLNPPVLLAGAPSITQAAVNEFQIVRSIEVY